MISIKDVDHVAKLARLSLSDHERTLYAEQLGKILAYFDQLNQVDTKDIEPMAHALSVFSVMRDDVVEPSPGHEAMIKNAPCQEKGFFKVPKIGE